MFSELTIEMGVWTSEAITRNLCCLFFSHIRFMHRNSEASIIYISHPNETVFKRIYRVVFSRRRFGLMRFVNAFLGKGKLMIVKHLKYPTK